MVELEQFGAGATIFLGFGGSLKELIKIISELGLGHLEVICEPQLLYPREVPWSERAKLKRTFQQHGVTPSVHASFYDVNLASLNPLIGEASVRQLLECIEFARDLGATIAVVHPGELPGDYPEELLPRARENLVARGRRALELAERLEVTLALENKGRGWNRGLIQSPEEHLSLVEELGSPRCKIALDVGHAHTLGLDLVNYLEMVFPHLAEVHLHDNDGRGDQHRPLGEGTIPFAPFLSALGRQGFRGSLILETVSVEDLKRSAEYLTGLSPPL